MHIDPLFRPFQLGQFTLPNRIVMAPMTRKFSPGGIPGEDVAGYYRRRAEGGVGLIITEGTTIGRQAASNSASIPNFHAPKSLEGWARVVSEVHAAGGKIAPQLWHQGSVREGGTGPHPDAPSEGPVATDAGVKMMSDGDIADTVDAYARSAASAKRIGFDAVELHGAHGYLIDQFLWAGTNARSDAYGGTAVERTRFAVEVVRAVRQAIGPDMPLIFRYSQWKLQDYAARLAETPAALESLLVPLADAGVDIFHASTRRFWEPEFAGSHLNLAGWSRKLTGLPSISVGSVGLAGADFMEQLRGDSAGAQVDTLDALIDRLGRDEFDLIAVGRALLSDPQWPTKVRQGRIEELIPFNKASFASLS
ncbi:NADH:flavin oxidoreductase [Oleiagrimonas soli]|uniref:1,2-oxophytodienoate reductase n=1 Tax=Oleiagrimonas soli TaxID=1543381 RepID=A0A099CWX5_9GAMM|nr:NADH:flavin oxidoreductase [Oleiagrimonas soli]KGI78254.1 1,2-oxophytodienoate reductase [Oleiagrimonas soli]MBB6183271.1 2,4-dienoyl-CoA reductase-like NADH-dependent reductase (Old Yellow Enzyme family) [Oleiagrimonas soli]